MSSREIDILFEEISGLMRQRHWVEALQKGRTLLAMLPAESHADRAIVFYNLGVCYNELRQYAEAETQYAEACREDPSDADLWHNRANNQHHWGDTTMQSENPVESRGHFERARDYVLRAQQINPNDGDIRDLLAKIQHLLANFQRLSESQSLPPIDEAQAALVDASTLEERWQALVAHQKILLTSESLERFRFMIGLARHSQDEYGAEAVEEYVAKSRKLLRLLEAARIEGLEAAWERYVSGLIE